MKLLTLNSHSLLEEDYLKKTQIFVEEILQEILMSSHFKKSINHMMTKS